MESVFKMSDAQLKKEAVGEFWSSRREDLKKALQGWLSLYHSDYRWQVELYDKPDPTRNQFNILAFKGTQMHYMNVLNTGINVLVYGAFAHEFFYGPFQSEWFHKFCFVK